MENYIRETEHTGKRDLGMSQWIRTNLPNHFGFMVSDIDFYIYDFKKKVHTIVEVKTYSGSLKKWQNIMYKNLGKWISESSKKDGWKFVGPYMVHILNGNTPDNTDSHIEVTNIATNEVRMITEDKLIELLSLDYESKSVKTMRD